MTVQCITDNTTAVNGSPDETFAGVEDNWMRQSISGQNRGTETTLKVSKFASGDHNHALLQFDLSNIPSSQTISAATIYLRVSSAPGSTHGISMRSVLRNWGETTSTWTDYDTSVSWTTGGALGDGTDRTATASATSNVLSTDAGNWISFDVTTLVQDWYNAVLTNNGVHISRDGAGEDGEEILFHSSEATTGSRPELVVTYSAGGPSIPILTHHIRQQS